MRKALFIFVLLAFLVSPVTAAPAKSFPILRSLINCLLSKTKKSPPNSQAPTGSGIIKLGSGTLVINAVGNSGTNSSATALYAGSLVLTGGTLNLATTGIGLNTGNSTGSLTTSRTVMGGTYVFEISGTNSGSAVPGLSVLGNPAQWNSNVAGKTVVAGQDVEFVLNSLLAFGPVTYQWQRSSDQGATWTDLFDGVEISGSHTNRLIVRQVDKSMNGHLFKCLVYSNGTLNHPTVQPGLLTVL